MDHAEFREKMEEILNRLSSADQAPYYYYWKKILDSIVAEYEESMPKKRSSLADIVNRTRASSNLDLSTAIVYYKNVYEKSLAVTTEEIRKAYFELQRPAPENLTQNLRELASDKYDKRIVFRAGLASITMEGRKYIEKLLNVYELDTQPDRSSVKDVDADYNP